jgi:hypothetical protein
VRVRLVVAPDAVAGLSLYLAAPAGAALPPNHQDPCSNQGRNTCGTLGVGLYKDTGRGTRWFGDYRGAVPGAAHLFCIDASFWYASPSYGYETRSAVGLRNRDGAVVSLDNQERMAYAIWAFGRTRNTDRQAAVMLYTHALMGDVPTAELNPWRVNADVAAHYQQIARDSERLHGPYRIEADFPRTMTVARAATVRLRVIAASGAPVPDVELALGGDGASGFPSHVRTGSSGVAQVRFVPARAVGVQLQVHAARLASTRPRIYAATSGAAAVNGQRLAAPSAQRLRRTFTVRKVRVSPRVVTQASAHEATAGATINDKVVVKGLGGLRVRVHAHLWGPFATESAIRCTGRPYWSGSFVADGDGTYETAGVRVRQVGYYTYSETIKGRSGDVAYASRCAEAAETTVVRTQPNLTSVGEDVARPGSNYFDHFRVQGLDRTSTSVKIELFGPFSSSRKLGCRGAPRWTAAIAITGNGEYRAPAVKLRRPGVYLFRHTLAASPLMAAFATPCNETAFTTIAAPRILTGRGDRARAVVVRRTIASRPVRLRLARLGIDAPISPVGVDLRRGVLAIPGSIRRLGWWSDSSTPLAGSGATLIAGHVDGASGVGAFFSLRLARAGDTIELTTVNEAVHSYTVTSIRTYSKNRLPLDVYSRAGAPRLVLVTCGGRFDLARGHYPDNIVVTARPA